MQHPHQGDQRDVGPEVVDGLHHQARVDAAWADRVVPYAAAVLLFAVLMAVTPWAAAMRTIRVLNDEQFDVLHVHEPLVPGPSVTALLFWQSLIIAGRSPALLVAARAESRGDRTFALACLTAAGAVYVADALGRRGALFVCSGLFLGGALMPAETGSDASQRIAEWVAEALVEALHVNAVFNIVNRMGNALGWSWESDEHVRAGARVIRLTRYRLPGFLLR